MAAPPNYRQTTVTPLPDDQELPPAMNVEGAQPAPQPGFVLAHYNLIRIVLVFVVLAIGYGFAVKIGVLIAKKAHSHHHQDPFKCQEKVVVALNGGQYTSVSGALQHAPDKSARRFCIFIKSGIYRESIFVGEEKTNIVLIGEGKNNTVITSTGMQNISATAVVLGNRFIAINLTFENMGMALNSSSDEAVFYNCKIRGNHHTLNAERYNQFFRDCTIYGNNSIVVGEGSVYFQNCHIYVGENKISKPHVVTLQGGQYHWLGGGFVFDHCTIEPIPGSRTSTSNHTYLGCPGGTYSTVLFVQSFISGMINSKGWTYCEGYRPQNIFYGEFNNTGPGSDTKNRVQWSGVKVLTPSEATKFTLENFFLNKTDWLSSIGIPYRLN